MFVNSMLIE